MNPEIGELLDFPCKGSIVIDKNMSWKGKYRTLRHEVAEWDMMQDKGYPYWKAHLLALRDEGKTSMPIDYPKDGK